MILSYSIALSVFAAGLQVSAAVPINDQRAADELNEMKINTQLAQLQLQLGKLQKDLTALRADEKPESQAASATSSQKDSRASDTTAGELGDESIRATNQQRRGVGWQPLKRVAEPSTANQASFRLAFNEPVSLRQEMVEVVENHLLQDLEAARKYGIEPQEILQDLRRKHND